MLTPLLRPTNEKSHRSVIIPAADNIINNQTWCLMTPSLSMWDRGLLASVSKETPHVSAGKLERRNLHYPQFLLPIEFFLGGSSLSRAQPLRGDRRINFTQNYWKSISSLFSMNCTSYPFMHFISHMGTTLNLSAYMPDWHQDVVQVVLVWYRLWCARQQSDCLRSLHGRMTHIFVWYFSVSSAASSCTIWSFSSW